MEAGIYRFEAWGHQPDLDTFLFACQLNKCDHTKTTAIQLVELTLDKMIKASGSRM